jgi:Ras-related protein Rab-21
LSFLSSFSSLFPLLSPLGEYNDRQVSTLQASYLDKTVDLGSQSVQLSIWDTAGQERFHALGPIYYRDADGALLVYDITDAESFNKVTKWVKELRKIVGNDICIAIAGNKVDLEKDRAVKVKDALDYAAQVGASHYNTSAKINKGLEDAFGELSKSMLKRRTDKAGSASSGAGAKQRLVIVEDAPTSGGGQSAGKKSGCC